MWKKCKPTLVCCLSSYVAASLSLFSTYFDCPSTFKLNTKKQKGKMTKLGNRNWTSNSENKLKSCDFSTKLNNTDKLIRRRRENASANIRNKEMGLGCIFYKHLYRILMKKN